MHSPGFVTNLMARKFAAALQNDLRDLGIAPAQFMVLVEMLEGDGLTQRELVDRLEVEQATMANTLARMERDGLIQRAPSESDGRARLVFVTPKGKEMRDAAMILAQDVNNRATRDLTPDEAKTYLTLTKKMVEALKRP